MNTNTNTGRCQWANCPRWAFMLMVLLMSMLFSTGCAPVKVLDVVEIKPNETAWAIPLDAASQGGQVKFNSIDFLNQKKVASKRIMVDKVERSIGRMWFDIEWIPATRVIKVDRSLVTREWTADTTSGTALKDEGIHVNTMDNIKLDIGITITVNINEDDASTYLYYHGERPLADVTDQNIRSFVTKVLSQKVSSMNLADFQGRQSEIYKELSTEVTTEFKEKGITVQYVGNAKGWNFQDQKIQQSINASYIAQQDNKTAEMEQNAQKTRNQTGILTKTAEAQATLAAQEVVNRQNVETSEAQASAAKNLLAAKDAAEFQNQLKIKLLEAEAKMKMASVWNGQLPTSIIPSDSPLLMNLGAAK